jgi:hypothetical protein
VEELVVVETRSRTQHYTRESLLFGFTLAFATCIEKESSLGTQSENSCHLWSYELTFSQSMRLKD